MNNLLTILVLITIAKNIEVAEGKGSQWFTREGTFKVPAGVKIVRVIVVGGGGGGTNGHNSGGAGGYVKCASLPVQSGDDVPVNVGIGGKGAQRQLHSNRIVGCSIGRPSSFGAQLIAAGGGGCKELANGNAGGTGSGAVCWAYGGGNCRGKEAMGGGGGAGGSDGGRASDGTAGAKGQGAEYLNCLRMARHNKLTAGEGGKPVDAICWPQNNYCWGAGGGGGGVLINGQGGAAFDGKSPDIKLAGEGGKGYGAGGGGGGMTKDGYRHAGGDGEDGLVYIEWD